MAYKIFLLERELGYPITADTNGLILMQRLRMLDRFWLDEQNAIKETNNNTNTKKSELLK